jgi:hypothetical protein
LISINFRPALQQALQVAGRALAIHAKRRSPSSNAPCTISASAAAGIAPDRSVTVSLSANP